LSTYLGWGSSPSEAAGVKAQGKERKGPLDEKKSEGASFQTEDSSTDAGRWRGEELMLCHIEKKWEMWENSGWVLGAREARRRSAHLDFKQKTALQGAQAKGKWQAQVETRHCQNGLPNGN